MRGLSPASRALFNFVLDLTWGSRPRLYDATRYRGLRMFGDCMIVAGCSGKGVGIEAGKQKNLVKKTRSYSFASQKDADKDPISSGQYVNRRIICANSCNP